MFGGTWGYGIRGCVWGGVGSGGGGLRVMLGVRVGNVRWVGTWGYLRVLTCGEITWGVRVCMGVHVCVCVCVCGRGAG